MRLELVSNLAIETFLVASRFPFLGLKDAIGVSGAVIALKRTQANDGSGPQMGQKRVFGGYLRSAAISGSPLLA